MITCREFVEFLGEYLSGELPRGQRRLFDAHLAVCPPCVLYLQTYEATIRMGRELIRGDAPTLPEEVPEELVRAVLSARETSAGR